MPGAYRDDREAALAKIAELQAELDKHRAKIATVTELIDAVDAIANPRRITMISLAAMIGLATLTACAYAAHASTLFSISGVALFVVFLWIVMRTSRTSHPLRIDDEEPREQMLTRFRIAEAKTARAQLNDGQKIEIEEEERICAALQEEIEQMKKLVEP